MVIVAVALHRLVTLPFLHLGRPSAENGHFIRLSEAQEEENLACSSQSGGNPENLAPSQRLSNSATNGRSDSASYQWRQHDETHSRATMV